MYVVFVAPFHVAIASGRSDSNQYDTPKKIKSESVLSSSHKQKTRYLTPRSRLGLPGNEALPNYGLFVREITARNNPFHQPFLVQFPGEYRFHMARTWSRARRTPFSFPSAPASSSSRRRSR